MSMADNRRRPDYSAEYSSEPYESKPKDAADPLAELARLIGQSDPFADAGRPGARKPLDGFGAADRPAPEWLARPASAQERDENDYETPRAAQRYDDASGYRAEDYQEPYDQPAADDPHPREAAHDPRDVSPNHAHAQHADDPADYADDTGYQSEAYQADDRYRVTPPPPPDYDDPYYDGHMPPHGEDVVPGRSRRGGVMTIAAVLGLAVIGTAGAFGYRAFTSGPSTPATPPVIKADTAPAKIVPPTANADAASKPFQERVGAAPAAERVVSREEQPVALPVAPARPSAPPPGPSALAAPAPLMAPTPLPGGGVTEPKRVKTMIIRPDNAGGEVNDSAAPSGASRTPAARQSGPLPIAPQSEPASRTKLAARPAPAAAAPSGAYVVQVSAQKSESEAQSSYRALQAKYPAVLGGREASIRRVDLGGSGVWYRAQVGSFASASQADEFCGRLKNAGGQCIVQKN